MLRPCEPPGELRNRRVIDLTRDRWEVGYSELVKGLRAVDSVVLESPISPSLGESRDLSDFVVRKLRHFFDFSEARIRDFALVFDELVQNALEHGGKRGHDVRMRCQIDTERLVLEVGDAGRGFDLRDRIRAARALLAENPTIATGRGLVMVDHVCDELSNSVIRGRHVVTAVIGRTPFAQTVDSLAHALAAEGPTVTSFLQYGERYAYVRVRLEQVRQETAGVFRAALGRGWEAFLGRGQEDTSWRFILDISSVAYIASAGLRELMLLQKQARAHGVQVELVGVRPAVAEIFSISKYDLVFPTSFGTAQEAVGGPER
jgi:anti-anti-sigma factor